MVKTIATEEELTESTVIQEEEEEAEIESGSSSLANSQVQKLQKKIESRLKSLNNSQRVRPDYCIFRIPNKLYNENRALYLPQYVSIGPHHIGSVSEVDTDQKSRYLASFLNRARQTTPLNSFITLINWSEHKIQGCYEGSTRTYGLREIEAILVDAGFILELLLRYYYSKEWRDEKDVIFAKSGTIHDIKQDLMLLENQLPFFLLMDIYQLAFSGDPDFPSFVHLTCHFFSNYYNQNISIQDVLSKKDPQCAEYRSKLEKAKHFTDMVRTFQQPYSFKKEKNEDTQKPNENEHEKILEEGKMQGDHLYSAVLLLEAGVKFKVSSGKCLFDIEFDHGELKIPPLKVDNSTESFYANLMVWEQCYYPNDTFICDYILLMAYLIKSVKDVDLLVRRRIIVNQLGSPDAIVALFNRLSRHIRVEKNQYSILYMKLNEYNFDRCHGWMAILKLQYFSTPWKGVATIAATILLVLNLIQTICAILSL